MAYVVVYEGHGGELFVHVSDDECAAGAYREECAEDDRATSSVVTMSDEVDWNAFEDLLPFLDTVKALHEARDAAAIEPVWIDILTVSITARWQNWDPTSSRSSKRSTNSRTAKSGAHDGDGAEG